MENILEIKGLEKRYNNGRGVWDIDISVCGGDVYGFLGPNGSGKTTTLKTIVGLLRKTKGEIVIDGFNTETHFEQAIRKTGVVFESIDHYDNMSAYDNMMQIARYFPEIDTIRIDELLELVGLRQYKKERVAAFSLGMRQRLAMAGAMYHRPALMVLDEPLNGLDIEGVIEMRGIITELAKNTNTAFVISSHNAAEIEKTCNRVGIIKEGKMVCHGEVADILSAFPSIEDYFVENTKRKGESL